MSPSRSFTSCVSASLGASTHAREKERLSDAGSFVSCLRTCHVDHEVPGSVAINITGCPTDLGQLKKCVWGGDL